MAKILVVDDDEALRRLMHLELGNNFDIIDSGEPEQGLALALEYKPDVILLDLRMPKYSGYELLQTFTSFSRTQMIPVIIVSGEGGGQTKEHCQQLGATGYFEKPIDFEALREYLRQVAKTRRPNPSAEVRVRLHVPLNLRGTDCHGKKFEEATTTENVSPSGFLFNCTAELPANSIIEVYMTSPDTNFVGTAKIVQSGTKTTPVRHYECRFVEKTGPWVLQ
jgi:CheY-like chemotaxis protein